MSDNSTIKDVVYEYCSRSESTILISSGIAAIKFILVLPLCIFVLYLGHQQWRQQRSFKTASHSDIFTYHLSLIELIWTLGLVCYLYGIYSGNLAPMMVGTSSYTFTAFIQMMIHVLTCVERYLAVLHPIIYLRFRNHRGVRIRNISLSCVWLLSFGLIILWTDLSANSGVILLLCFMAVSILVVTFCSFSVLWVLIRPGPGEGGGGKVDQSKLRAFLTITAILSVLWMWFVAIFVSFILIVSGSLPENDGCVLMASVSCLSVPTSLLGPLLYLHRAGKLSWSCLNHE